MDTRRGDGTLALTFTMLATLAALACFIALWRLPVYESGTITDGHTVTTTQTLAQENGNWVLLLAAVPVFATLVAWLGLYATCARGSRVGRAVAGIVTGLLGGFALLGIFTIGVFVLPCAALLCGAVVTTPRGG